MLSGWAIAPKYKRASTWSIQPEFAAQCSGVCLFEYDMTLTSAGARRRSMAMKKETVDSARLSSCNSSPCPVLEDVVYARTSYRREAPGRFVSSDPGIVFSFQPLPASWLIIHCRDLLEQHAR